MRKLAALFVLAVLLVLFVSVNVVAQRTLRGARLDLTEGRVFTLTAAARSVARSPSEPVTLRYYLSESVLSELPGLAQRVGFVEDTLRAFEAASGGKVRVEVIDPEPATEAEDAAIAEGLAALPTPAGNVFIGIVGTNTVEGREVIPVLNLGDPGLERFLEFEIAKMIDRLSTDERPRLGVISGLPLMGGAVDPRTGRGAPRYQLMAELESVFELVAIDEGANALPADLDALLVAHPKSMTEPLLYAVDQFVLSGGDTVFFLDPLAESDFEAARGGDPMASLTANRTSQSIPTLAAWGVEVTRGSVIGDPVLAPELPDRRGRLQRFVHILELGPEAGGEDGWVIAPDDPATGRLGALNVRSAGAMSIGEAEAGDEGPGATLEPLLRTTGEGGLLGLDLVRFEPDAQRMLADLTASGPLTIAARVSGEGLPSAWADGPPAGAAEGAGASHLAAAPDGVSVVVVGDVDLLADPLWLTALRVGGQVLGYQRVRDNGAMVVNILDQMAGSGELLALRARSGLLRPLTLIEEMEAEADAAIAKATAAVNERIEAAQARIDEIERGRTDAGQLSSLWLTPEQEAELDAAREAIAEGRAERRRIVVDLRRDLERVKTQITLINTAMVPAMLCVFAVGLSGWRAVRRRVDRRRAA